MARPIKKGLDYFPVDTDIFENIQVRKLKSRYKSFGFLAYFTLLCDIYKKEGYFLQLLIVCSLVCSINKNMTVIMY